MSYFTPSASQTRTSCVAGDVDGCRRTPKLLKVLGSLVTPAGCATFGYNLGRPKSHVANQFGVPT